MNFKANTLVKALAFATAVASAASAQSTCCWNDVTPAGAGAPVNLFTPGQGLTFTHHTGPIGASETWGPTELHFMDRDIRVPSGSRLTVKPGTWIFAGPWQFVPPVGPGSWSYIYGSSLIVERGGVAIMKGKADSVIVMTGFGDDPRDIATFGPGAVGMWGGLVIAGRAPVSNYVSNPALYPCDNSIRMEGMGMYKDSSCSHVDGDIWYGGTNAADSSGVYEYLSVRHGGCGNASASEINGISFYGVGNKTVFDHVEVMSNFDDGFEFFGGTINVKYLVSAFNQDDMFDIDMGYSGKMQFLFADELGWMGNRVGEWDGNKPGNPFTSGLTMANVTLIGSGKCTVNNINGGGASTHDYSAIHLVTLADSLKGMFRNILIVDGPQYTFRFYKQDYALPEPFGPAGMDWQGCMTYNMGNGTTWDKLIWSDASANKNWPKLMDPIDSAARVTYLNNPANKMICNADPLLRGVSREFGFPALDPRPCASSPCLNPAAYAATPSDPFFTPAPYVGAFNATDLWCDGWTKLSQAGVLSGILSTTPSREIMPSTANFDLAYTINDPAATPVGVTVLLDNLDVTSTLVPMFLGSYGSIPCGGWFLRAASIPASAVTGLSCNGTGTIPAVNYNGLHTFKTTWQLADGRTLTGVSKIKITQ